MKEKKFSLTDVDGTYVLTIYCEDGSTSGMVIPKVRYEMLMHLLGQKIEKEKINI